MAMNNNNPSHAPQRRPSWHKPLGYGGLTLAAALLTVAAYATFSSVPGSIRLAPVGLTVQSSGSLPAEVRALEAQTAPLLFDRDTTTSHVVYGDASIEVKLDRASDFQGIKVYGPAPYELSVQAQQGSGWTPVAGLDKLKLSALPAAWSSFTASRSVSTGALRLLISPAAGAGNGQGNGQGNNSASTGTGLPEIEIWAAGQHALLSEAALVDAVPRDNAQAPAVPQVRSYAATPASTVIGKDGQALRFTLDRPAARFKRAWLSYEAYGLSHWVSPVRRLNGRAVQGGAFTFSGTAWSPLTEPLHPDWLVQGENRIEFALPPGASGSYSVRNVRVVAELDDGNNFIARATTGASASGSSAASESDTPTLIDGDLSSGWSPYGQRSSKGGKPELTLYFDKPTQLQSLNLYLVNALSGTLSVDVLVAGQWQSAGLPTLNGNKLGAGWNPLTGFAALPAQAARITFLNGAGSPADVREITAVGSGVGPAHAAAITVAYPDAGQFYGRQAYLRGYLAQPDNGSGPATLTASGKAVPMADGSFGVLISKDEAGFANQADGEPWQVELVALYPNGQKLTRVVQLTKGFDASKARGVLPNLLNPGFAQTLTVADASIELDPDAADPGTKIKIIPLSEKELPRLDPGMTNVTRGPHRGYRFTPTPFKFKKNIKVTLPFDGALIPRGHKEDDVKTYYFDTQAGHWVPLDRVVVDSGKKRITSLTNHFTDMINATMTVPDHPQATSFNPTQIKDIKAADPGAGINLIEPPQANNTGDARLSYPIQIPQGRQGMQPQLGISYNSGGGNGWLGQGWDLAVPSISIETRWGVPRYDAKQETETYLLNGEMLTPVAHRGALQERKAEKIFHTRVEGAFRKIIRHGDTPANYWWEVVDKNGTKSFYGGTGKAQDAGSILSAEKGVFKWMLSKTEDFKGNTVTYAYERLTSHVIPGGGTTTGLQLYLKSINYTGHKETQGAYTVNFIRETGRPDIITDARGGFVQVTADRLKTIEVKYDKQTVRSYVLHYDTGPFAKTLLTSIVQNDSNGKKFNEHSFDYYDDIRKPEDLSYLGFRAPKRVDAFDDGLKSGTMTGEYRHTVLGGTKGSSQGLDGFVGVGFGGAKMFSVGSGLGYSKSAAKGINSFVDVDGDGLPDKVFIAGDHSYYRSNKTPSGNLNGLVLDASKREVPGFAPPSETKSSTVNTGVQGFVVGLTANDGIARTTTRDLSYLSDVNGDGLVDIVSQGTVRFGSARNTGVAGFSSNSFDSDMPLGKIGAAVDATVLPDVTEDKLRLEAENPLMDNVRRWVAPYDGVVRVTGGVQLVNVATDTRFTEKERQARLEYKLADGVRVSVQLNDAQPLWVQRILQTDFADYQPTNVDAISVKKNDRLYFRVQSVHDGEYDQVAWSPKVEYVKSGVAQNTLDVNGLNAYRFQAGEDFVMGNRPLEMATPYRGTLHLGGLLNKTAVTTDDVTLQITTIDRTYANGQVTSETSKVVVSKKIAWDYVGPITLNEDFEVQRFAGLKTELLVDSPIDLSVLKWGDLSKAIPNNPGMPLFYYTKAYQEAEQPLAPAEISTEGAAKTNADDVKPVDTAGMSPILDEDGNPLQLPVKELDVYKADGSPRYTMPVKYDVDIYGHNHLTSPQKPWVAPRDGMVLVTPWVETKRYSVTDAEGNVTEQPKDLSDAIYFTVKRRLEHLGKQRIVVSHGVVQKTSQGYHGLKAFAVKKGDEIFFDFSVRNHDLEDEIESASVRMHYASDTAWRAPVSDTVHFLADVSAIVSLDPEAPPPQAMLVIRRGAGQIAYSEIVDFSKKILSLDLPKDVKAGEDWYFDLFTVDSSVHLNKREIWARYQSDAQWTVPSTGSVQIVPVLNFKPDVPVPDGRFTLLVHADDRLVSEKDYLVRNGVLENAPLVLGVNKGQVLKFSYRTGDHALSSLLRDKGVVRVDEANFVSWQAPAYLVNGPLQVEPQFNLAGQVGDGAFELRILRGATVLTSRAYTVSAGVIRSSEAGAITALVNSADELQFELRSAQSDLAAALRGSKLRVSFLQNSEGSSGTTTAFVPFSVNLVDQLVGSHVLEIRMPYLFAVQAKEAAERHYAVVDPLFGKPYRGWANAAYNGNGDRVLKPIEESIFVMSRNERDYKDSSKQLNAWFAYPAVELNRWLNQDELWWTSPLEVSASRRGLDNVYDPRLDDLSERREDGYAGATRPPRMSHTAQRVSGRGFVLSKTVSVNTVTSDLDLLDMNGDRFPDVVGETTQYTWADGSFYDSKLSGPVRTSKDTQTSIGFSTGVPTSAAAAKGYLASLVGANKDTAEKSSVSVGGGVSKGENETSTELVDINGDGLPDRVAMTPSGLSVQLNTGYGFAAESTTWKTGQLTKGTSKGKSFNVGFAMWNGNAGGGISASENHNHTHQTLMDINGDGLPDLVSADSGALSIHFNHGAGFIEEAIHWPGAMSAYKSLKDKSLGSTTLGDGTSSSDSVSAKVGYGFQVWFITISFSIGVNSSDTVGQPSLSYVDFNGDGLVDGVRSANDGNMDVALNPIQRTNLLKQVRRPLGGRFEIDYTRSGNTFDQPQSKWVMSEVRMFDGVANDTPPAWLKRGSDWQRQTYVYDQGKYDRFEREFLGYKTVYSFQHDTAGLHGVTIAPAAFDATPVFRKTVQEYSNSSVYDKGLLQKETLFDGKDQRYTETQNSYDYWRLGDEIKSTVSPLSLDRFTERASATLFPRLRRTDKRFYEGQGQAGQSSYTEQAYDERGNITSFKEGGSHVPEVAATIGYTACETDYIVGRPKSINVTTSTASDALRMRDGDFNCAIGNFDWQRSWIGSERYAKTAFTWDSYGNLQTLTGPKNHKGESIELVYQYDAQTNTYPVRVDNLSYTLQSTATYIEGSDASGLFYGKPLTVTDTNGNVLRTRYDSNGRTEWIQGPQEKAKGQPWTIRFSYFPFTDTSATVTPQASYARTEHADRNAAGSYKNDPIETVLFTDGTKRVLQTKKDASVAATPGAAPQNMMIVSGRTATDALGRSIAQYYPTAKPKGAADLEMLLAVDDSARPTVTDYDVLDRATRTELPDGSSTAMAYGFGTDAFGSPRFETTVTDANGNTKRSLRDVRELITTIVEENRPFGVDGKPTSAAKIPSTTRYVYDALKQITQVIDAKGNTTRVDYDNLGRRTHIDNPDTGLVETVYDDASNPIKKITANLRKEGEDKAVQYDYDHTRLKAIHYPLYPDADVTYEYGTEEDRAKNQAGRIKRVFHQSGNEVREYGLLGEVVKQTLTLKAAANGGSTPPVYTTAYDFDSFGRLQNLTLPDGETISHHYDSGGNIQQIDGRLNGTPYTYLKRLDYDRFESRVFMKVGNGVETRYTYDPTDRRLANLHSGSPGKPAMQDMAYGYDKVGNITSLVDSAPIPRTNEYGGQSTQNFQYDDLYRLVSADGVYTTAREVQNYTLAMAYDAIHNITHKAQQHTVSKIGGTPRIEAATTYDWAYSYPEAGKARPHAPTHIGQRSFDYDENGNQHGWKSDENGTRRVIVWDEDNRIREVQDPKHGAAFSYDDQGERKLRKSQYGEVAYVNQFFSVRNGAIASTHVYAGTSRVVTKVGAGTPVGSTHPRDYRGTGNLSTDSPIGGSVVVQETTGTVPNIPIVGVMPTAPVAGNGNAPAAPGAGTPVASDPAARSFPGQGLEHRSDRANEVARNTEKNKHLNGGVPGGEHGAGNSNAGGNGSNAGGNAGGNGNGNGHASGNSGQPGGNAGGNSGNPGSGSDHEHPGTGNGNDQGGGGDGSGNVGDGREFIYFYHPDHLGSTGYVTDEKALRYEHIAYFPFGETWVQESSATWRVPYQFTSKEMDSETGLYYFGARYYDPRTGVWQSADPILGRYIGSDSSKLSTGGVFNSTNLGLYTYGSNNPIIMKDPDGNDDVVVIYGGYNKPIVENPYTALDGNTGSGALANKIAAEHKGRGVQVLAYATGGDDGRNISDGMKFVDAHRKDGDSVVIYGYSRGGDAAVGLADALQKRNIKVDLLTVVDSYNPDSQLLFTVGNLMDNRGLAANAAKNEASPNVRSFYNFYQTKSKGQHGQIFTGGNALNVNMRDSYHSTIDENTAGIIKTLIDGALKNGAD